MLKLLKEPLLHFLLLGAILFALFSWVGDDNYEQIIGSKEIVITPGIINTLSANFEKVWQRPPTQKEREGLIREFIREEILYREALALGLDRDDTIVRRRMRQKLEFLFEDLTAPADPSEEELLKHLSDNATVYLLEPRVSFHQVYLNPEKRGEAIKEDVNKLLSDLRTPKSNFDLYEIGDSLMIEQSYESISQSEAARYFGQQFADEIVSLEPGTWQGPILSGYGLHLVFVSERIDGRMPILDEVRKAVERDWLSAIRKQSNEGYFEKLLETYTITIEHPVTEDDSQPSVVGAL